MKLRLHEDRREWLKTNAVLAVLATLLAWHGTRRGWWSLPGWSVAAPGLLLLTTALLSRAWARLVYRGTLRVGFALGRVMSTIVLTAVFALVLVPTAWLLRRRKFDPLRQHDHDAEIWWEAPSGSDERARRF